ncbi:MAG TPA: nitrogenase molybdenum-iron protein subunit alpha, partial [Methanocorpusculum sp.]|nr:nitrogenase molybdenum-iron protein subunit alpha [Methanocorpusculum sp.]
MDKKQKKWLILSIAISVTVLFVVLFFTVDVNTLTELKNCNIWFILLAILMHIISICFWANRIQIM